MLRYDSMYTIHRAPPLVLQFALYIPTSPDSHPNSQDLVTEIHAKVVTVDPPLHPTLADRICTCLYRPDAGNLHPRSADTPRSGFGVAY